MKCSSAILKEGFVQLLHRNRELLEANGFDVVYAPQGLGVIFDESTLVRWDCQNRGLESALVQLDEELG